MPQNESYLESHPYVIQMIFLGLWTLDFEVDAGMSAGLLGWNERYSACEKDMKFGRPGAECYRPNVCVHPKFLC